MVLKKKVSKKQAKRDEQIRKNNAKQEKQEQKRDNSKDKRAKKFATKYDTLEDVKFSQNLLKLGLKIHSIEGDGSCLFRAIADQLCGDQSKHHEFRNQITSYMIEHKDHFELFVEDDEPFDDYMDRMKTHGEWGGNQELYAASQALQVDITIYQLDAPCYSLKGSDTGKLQNISLSYHGECHYNSVRTVDVGETASLRIENTTTKVSTTLTPSEQTVANALNWAKVDDIKLALELMNDDTDEAIDFLCINMYNMNSISSSTNSNVVTSTTLRGSEGAEKGEPEGKSHPREDPSLVVCAVDSTPTNTGEEGSAEGQKTPTQSALGKNSNP